MRGRAPLVAVAAVLSSGALAAGAHADTASYAITGEYVFTVPANVTSVHVVAIGATGASGQTSGPPAAPGGLPGQVTGDVAVTPGETLYVEVAGAGSSAGAGGYNGGGSDNANANAGGGGGGGASDVRTTPHTAPLSPDPRLIVAAGGGGGGANYNATGAPGGAAEQPGASYPMGGGGGGAGTSIGPGAGGSGCGTPCNGALGNGGPGGSMFPGGGGGGGGYYGGGGGGSTGASLGGGGGGGSDLVPAGGSKQVAPSGAAPRVEISYQASSPAAGGGGAPPPGGQSGGGPSQTVSAAVTAEIISPSAFRAAPSGPSALASRVRFGAKVTYSLNQATAVRFTVTQRKPGRRAKSGACTAPSKSNRKGRRCTRVVTLRGSFTRTGVAGTNSFRFTGRLGGRTLKPGRYLLVATPAQGGTPKSSGFRVVR